jgi:quercetin dioxygenase-like cupin family protein
MIQKHQSGKWDGVDVTQYKNEPGTWMEVDRHVLFSTPNSGFEVRVFDLRPGGYSSYEKHEHEHCVIVLKGAGRVRLGDDWYDISEQDQVSTGPWQPHQFVAGDQGLTIMCAVDKVRDVPVHLQPDSAAEASKS